MGISLTLITLGTGALTVFGLSALLLILGRGARNCPVSGPAAMGATITVLGAYLSMGLGIAALLAAFAGEMHLGGLPTMLVAAGGTAIVAGIGFTIAATTLRDALIRVRQEARADAEAGILPSAQPETA